MLVIQQSTRLCCGPQGQVSHSAAVHRDSIRDSVQRTSIIRTVVKAGSAKRMAKSNLKVVSPATVNRTVIPRRSPNSTLRTREYLTEAEVERLMNAAKRNRWGHRDATMVL